MASDKPQVAPSAVGQQLWAKNLPLDAIMHRFTVGRDPEVDLHLYAHDCVASAAHVRMLQSVTLLSKSDAQQLLAALRDQYELALQNNITIRPEQEDGHTALESALIDACGEAGKRVHVARSRNDQVLVALRLYLRAQVDQISIDLQQLVRVLLVFATQHAEAAMPGYTHMRAAMPSSFGLWAAAFAEGLMEELQATQGLYQRLDRCPLGAAAGFGVPIAIDRTLTAYLLGFEQVQRSPIDCMNSRGRHEQAVLDAACSIAGVLEKLLWDLALYSTEEYGFVKLPTAFTTGSSIMPQKRNPDVIELARAKCRQMRGYAHLHRETISGLPSSYHRDLQLAKAPLIDGLQLLHELCAMLTHLIPALEVDVKRTAAACADELFATEAAYELVQAGTPFRDAYRTIAAQVSSGEFNANALRARSIQAAQQREQLARDVQQLTAELSQITQLSAVRRAAEAHRINTIWNLL